jgi:Zn-dependent metalloprotease
MKSKMALTLAIILTMSYGPLLSKQSAQSPARRASLAQPQARGRVINNYRGRRVGGENLNQEAGRPDWVNSAVRRSVEHLESRKEKLGLNEVSEDLRLVAADQDDFGKTHLRLQQSRDGVEVFGSQLISHLDGGKVASVGGRAVDVTAVDTTPTLGEGQAIEAAKKELGYTGEFADEPKAKLVVLPHSVFSAQPTGEASLTWQVTLHVEDGTSATAMHQYFVDAKDGKVVWHYDSLPKDGTGYSLYNGTVPVPSVYAPPSGIFGAHYNMQDPGHGNASVFDMNGGTAAPRAQFIDSDNIWGDGTVGNSQSAAVDAQYGVAKAWDYFASVFGRRGWDNAGMEVDSHVHYGANYNNAFETPGANYLSFGDGDGSRFSPLVSLDVVAHEFTHGITEHTAGLIYANESGALNESFSDIFGTAVEFNYKSDANYLIAEQCYTPGSAGDALRDMANPTVNSYGSRYYQGACTPVGDPNNPNYNDNCGVHTNSGIMNNVFYLLAVGGTHPTSHITVPSIGRRNAEQIFYRALTLYLTPSAKFYDARVATVNAAVDFFGTDSVQHRAVEAAWEAVGVSAPHLLFYNAANGSGSLVQVTQSGELTQLNSFGLSSGWTDILPVREHVFFYNSGGGQYAVTKVDQNGGMVTLSSGSLPANMNKVVSTDGNLLFYSATTHGGLIAHVGAAGNLIQTKSYGANSFSSWTHIVDTGYGLFFYNRGNGIVVVGNVNQDGVFVQTDSGKTISSGYDQVVVQGSNLLFYNNATGGYGQGSIDSAGKFSAVTITSCGSALQPGYRTIIAAGTNFFFYNPDNGAAAVGNRLPANIFTVTTCWNQLSLKKVYAPYNFSPGWTNIVNTANGVLFYNSGNGSTAVGYFGVDGGFVQTAWYPDGLSANWSNIVTTER